MLDVSHASNKEATGKVQSDFSAVNLIGYNLYEITQIIIKERENAKQMRKSGPG